MRWMCGAAIAALLTCTPAAPALAEVPPPTVLPAAAAEPVVVPAADAEPTVVTVERTADGLEVTTQPTEGLAHARRVMARQRANDDTLAVELDSPVQALGAADPLQGQQWGLEAIEAPAVWPRTTGRSVVVAVLDTGVDGAHEDLAGRVLPGRDLTSRTGGTADSDPNGHGTHLAGIVGATAGNGVGGAGTAPGVTILPVRVLDAAGAGFSSQVAAGIIWAADNGADIINLSLGGPVASQAQKEAIDYAVGRGALVVAAAGNEHTPGGADVPQYPAALPNVVAVGAVTPTREPASFSTWGQYVDLAAPGTMIASTVPGGGYATYSGTSMATPFVSGVAALVQAVRPMPPAELAAFLRSTAVDVIAPGPDAATGAGVVSARRAVEALTGPLTPAVSTPAPAPRAAVQVAKGVVKVRPGRRVVLSFPAVAGSSYTWSVQMPGGAWRALPKQRGAALRTPRMRPAMNGVRYKLVAAGEQPVFGVVRVRVVR